MGRMGRITAQRGVLIQLSFSIPGVIISGWRLIVAGIGIGNAIPIDFG
jgi:hypothetical protein